MPIFAALWGALQYVLGSYIGKILLYLGVSYYTFTGMSLLVDSLKVVSFNVLNEANGMSVAPQLSGLFGLMRLGEAFNVYFSAFMASLTLKGLNSMGGHTITKVGIK
jgi:D-alanyl-lipoteichoic acid acyltransferase DltB (MBOAT superfamily)